jgi:molybdopterin-binding protein
MKKTLFRTSLMLLILLTSLVSFLSFFAFAQQMKMGEPVRENIKVRIDQNGTAHVVHTVQGNANSPVTVETIQGNITNIIVTDVSNDLVQYLTLQQTPVSVMIPPSERNVTLIKYDLPNIVSLDDNVWRWNYFTPSDTFSTDFYFPSGVNVIWANDRPVYIGENGISQHGDYMKLEYATNEKTFLHNIKWQNYTFPLEIDSLSNVDNYTFDQPTMSYQFQTSKSDSFVTVIMPKSLLGAKYAAHIHGNHLLTTVFHDNGTHAWIGLRPSANGTIQITGSTTIPEFPLFLPLAIGVSMMLILQFRHRFKG